MIKYSGPSGYFLDAWLHLAEQISDCPLPRHIRIADERMEPFVRLLYEQDIQPDPHIVYESSSLIPRPKFVLKNKRRCLLGFSGGKDSIATAIRLQRKGLEVEAVHLKNLNRSAHGEDQASIDACRILGIPIHILPVKSSGGSERLENPCKNLCVLAAMVDFGAPQGIANYALGTQPDRPNGIDDFKTERDFSDSPLVLETGTKVFQQLKGFRLWGGLVGTWHLDVFDPFKAIYSTKHGHELMSHSLSCMSQVAYRASLGRKNEGKYGVKLFPRRCGSCFKCCIEYVILAAMKKVPANAGYLEHCWKRIREMHTGKDAHIVDRLKQMEQEAATWSQKHT